MPEHSDHERAMHRMAISYDKLRKSRQRHYGRLRSLVERLFPEFLSVLTLDTKTARYLLREALLPDEFLTLETGRVVVGMQRASRHQHGQATLLQLQELARHSVGQTRGPAEAKVEHRAAQTWLAVIELIEAPIKALTEALVEAACEHPCFASAPGVRRPAPGTWGSVGCGRSCRRFARGRKCDIAGGVPQGRPCGKR